jgi:hypothetical protein|tara:strand:+ start:309 stop:1577 length:1269 start_codon:yes stop_codon:yes gene_type:complete
MSEPTLTPVSQTSKVILPSGSTFEEANGAVASFPFSVYTDDHFFLTGAADQVAYTFHKLGGDVLDIELTKEQVFSSYQEAVLEYSYLLNIHQAKNSIGDLLGAKTGSFDEEGQLQDTTNLVDVALKFPKFKFEYVRRVGHGYSTEAGLGGVTEIYSASFTTVEGTQDYDLQAIVSSSATTDTSAPYYGLISGSRINVTKVYYKTPQAMWRFYGYYGGLNTVGDLASYGQYADDSTFQLVPTWQNKSQAMAFEDAIYTRNSHYSFEIKNNKLRIFPQTVNVSPKTMHIEFFIDSDTPWKEEGTVDNGVDGINNINTLPFENTPYQSINSIGKQWIRRFALAISKETLGNIRSKISTIPIPGDSVTLDGPALISQGQTEQEKLRDELKTIFDELTYAKIAQGDVELTDAVNKVQERIPMRIFVG